MILFVVLIYFPVFFFQVACKLYLRSKSVSPMSINRGHTVSSDSSSSLLKKRSGTMLLLHRVTGSLLRIIFKHSLCIKVEMAKPHNDAMVFFNLCREAETFITRGRNRIGSRYKKVRYVEYTDNTFMTKMLRSPEEQHLGILGKINLTRSGERMINKEVLDVLKFMYTLTKCDIPSYHEHSRSLNSCVS